MYENEVLLYFRRLLEKMRIQSHIVHRHNLPTDTIDFGLRKSLGREADYDDSVRRVFSFVEKNTVYKVMDAYQCNYIFLDVPDAEDGAYLVLGPYLSFEIGTERLMEASERFGFTASVFRDLESFYRNIPVISDDTYLMMTVSALAESLWGVDTSYRILDLKKDAMFMNIPPQERRSEESSIMQMRLMEQRYAYENELMDKVSKGLWHRAEMMLSSTALKSLEHRTADAVRNQKHYCIICNTLLRKAAERGGVHPLHLDRTSSQYAKQIERIVTVKEGHDLILNMTQSYCRLVRRHNVKEYSALIQKVVTYIEAELSADLSLKKLARLHNVSPEYLSSLFHKETQTTLTRFVKEKRLEQGADMLRVTNLQIQTIAEYCGIPDAGYFAKLFKQRYGMSPKAFRDRPEHVHLKEARPK